MPWENSLQELQRVRAEGVKRAKGRHHPGCSPWGGATLFSPFLFRHLSLSERVYILRLWSIIAPPEYDASSLPNGRDTTSPNCSAYLVLATS